MFIDSLRTLPDDFKVSKTDFINMSKIIIKSNPDLIQLKKSHESNTQFLNRIMPAFVLEFKIAEFLKDENYLERKTDTLDWNSFSWDVLDPKSGCRLEIKCANNHDVVITFADYSKNNKLFAFDGESLKVNNTIHIDNFVHENSKADALFVASYSIEEDQGYLYKTRFIGERLAVLKGYTNNGPSLVCKSKYKNGGLYIQGYGVTIPSWIEKIIKIPSTKLFTSD